MNSKYHTLISEDKVQFRTSTQEACGQHEIPEPTKQHNRYLSGWRFGAFVGVISATLVLITNVGALVGTITRQSAKEDGRIPLYEGSCSKVRKFNIEIHFAINVLSTILLGASNYCMQCASAPTREEIDKAHKVKKWLSSPRGSRIFNRIGAGAFIFFGLVMATSKK